MATGPVHLRAIVGAILPVWGLAVGSFMIAPTWWVCWLTVAFFFVLCRYVDPDADSFTTLSADWRIKRELGLLGVYMAGWWLIYAGQMDWFQRKGSHRSLLTHSVIPGTLTRVIWFDIPLIFPVAYLMEKFTWVTQITSQYILQVLVGQFIGFAIGDIIHLYLDHMWPFRRAQNYYIENEE